MTLKEVCELADACGLETVGEAVMNAELHYDALVLIDDMDKEFEELYREVKALGPEWESVSIYTIVKKMCCANCKRNYRFPPLSFVHLLFQFLPGTQRQRRVSLHQTSSQCPTFHIQAVIHHQHSTQQQPAFMQPHQTAHTPL